MVLWYLCPELNCAFEDLFVPVTEPDIRILNIRSLRIPGSFSTSSPQASALATTIFWPINRTAS